MNEKIKKIIIDNEYALLEKCEKYNQSIRQYIIKLQGIKYDAMLYDFIIRSFAGEGKRTQEAFYNAMGYKSSRQLILENKDELNLNDRLDVKAIKEDQLFTSMEICFMADNYNNQIGMYYLEDFRSVIIKSTVEDNDRPYDDKWLKNGIILRYCMQKENTDNVKSLNFSHKPNAVIFNTLMERKIIDIFVFVNKKRGESYRYAGIFHPCGIVAQNKAFLLYKSGHHNEIPFDNIEAQFLFPLIYSNLYENKDIQFDLRLGNINDLVFSNEHKIVYSKKNLIQQMKINLEVALRGEYIILMNEKINLVNRGYPELALKVSNISLDDMTLGYDIRSYTFLNDGKIIEKFIKVKSFVSTDCSDFSLSVEEFMRIKESNSKLYLIYDIYSKSPKYIDVNLDELIFSKDIFKFLLKK